MMCVPIREKDSVGTRSNKDSNPRNGPGYNVWGSRGYNGDGYAWEEGPTTNDLSNAGDGGEGGDGGGGMSEEKDACYHKVKSKYNAAQELIMDIDSTIRNLKNDLSNAGDGGEGGGGMSEEKDACYHKVKSKYDVFPSAYASGAIVQCRKKGAKNWGNKAKDVKEQEDRIEGKRKTAPSTAPHLNGYTKIDAISEDLNWNSVSERKSRAAQELIMDGVRRRNRIAEENLMQFRTKEQHDDSVLLNNTTMNDIAW